MANAMHTTHERTGAELVLTQCSYAVDGQRILQSLDLTVRANRIGIVGRNGSGKSTLARMVAGLIAPTDGEVRLNGCDLAKDRKAALSEVGIIFQNPDHQIIFPTVEEELAFGLRQQGKTPVEVDSMVQGVLAEFGKTHWAQTHISTLSQGQKHLVCLMAIVAMRPKAIILDEPFTGLDIPTKMQLHRYLNQYAGALIHISHDPADLSGYDHVIWLESGQVEQSGAATEVLAAYHDRMDQIGATDDISDLSH